MLSKAVNARLTHLGDVGFTKTYSFRTDDFELPIKLTEGQLRIQSEWPIHLMTDSNTSKKWWLFHDSFYWDDEDLDAKEVKRLILEREPQLDAETAELLRLAKEIKKKQKTEREIERAKAIISLAANAQNQSRQPIPDDVKMFVWQRDKGQCVNCGSKQNLEFDHIIPISMGGSNTARNLQILCEECNRLKGGNLV
ncbi:MAG: HNH endonuclease [Desulfomonilaceae bacterium]